MKTLGATIPTPYDRVRLHSNILPALLTSCPSPTAIFPQLRSFNWDQLALPHDQLVMFTSLLSSPLDSARIDISIHGPDVTSIIEPSLKAFLRQSSSIKCFVLHTMHQDNTPEHSSALSSAVIGFRHLTTFACNEIAIQEAAVAALAMLPALCRLSMRISDADSWESIAKLPDKFPVLEDLVVASTVEAFVALARAIKFLPCVTDFEIATIGVPQPYFVSEFCRAVREFLCPDNLQVIVVRPQDLARCFQDTLTAVNQGTIVTSEHLRPFLDFECLNKLDFNPPWAFSIDDDILTSMAEVYDDLRYFSLGADLYCLHRPLATTLKALTAFAINCPLLIDFGLRFDATRGHVNGKIPPHFYEGLDSRLSRPTLGHIHVDGGHPVSNPREVATFLSIIFPHIQAVDFTALLSSPTERRYQSLWEEVDDYVKLLHRIRVDERRWCESEAEDPPF